MKITRFTLLLIIILPVFAFGQAERYLFTGAGINYSRHLDKGMSPLVYQGPSLTGKAGYLKEKNRHISDLEIGFSYGKIFPKESAGVASLVRNTINYSLRWELNKKIKDRVTLYAGPSISLLSAFRINNRYGNNSINYDFLISLSPEVGAVYPFQILRRDMSISWDLFLPLVSTGVRPPYGNSVPEAYWIYEDNYMKAFFKSLQFWFPGEAFRINSDIKYYYHLKNGNKISVGYTWDFTSLKSIAQNGANTGCHIITFSTWFNF